MKTRTERKLEKIQRISTTKHVAVSCDIYYDSLRVDKKEQFVAKLTGPKIKAKWFRSDHIHKSLDAALDWIVRL